MTGSYNFGSGWQQAYSLSGLTGSQITGLTNLVMQMDYRYGYAGMGVDNISLTNSIPEPGTLVLLGCGLAGLLAYAWRKRR